MIVRHDMVTCHVIRRAGGDYRLLRLRRAAGDFMGGTWQSVSGRIEGGETAWEAALREVREEAGIHPVEFFQLDTVNTFYIARFDTLWHCPQFCAVAGETDEPRLNAEHDAARWVPLDQADSAVMWPGERAAIAEVIREIVGDGPARPFLRIDLHTFFRGDS